MSWIWPIFYLILRRLNAWFAWNKQLSVADYRGEKLFPARYLFLLFVRDSSFNPLWTSILQLASGCRFNAPLTKQTTAPSPSHPQPKCPFMTCFGVSCVGPAVFICGIFKCIFDDPFQSTYLYLKLHILGAPCPCAACLIHGCVCNQLVWFWVFEFEFILFSYKAKLDCAVGWIMQCLHQVNVSLGLGIPSNDLKEI